jgi:hypothetical protein
MICGKKELGCYLYIELGYLGFLIFHAALARDE